MVEQWKLTISLWMAAEEELWELRLAGIPEWNEGKKLEQSEQDCGVEMREKLNAGGRTQEIDLAL